MKASIHDQNKQLIQKYRNGLYNCDRSQLKTVLTTVFHPECQIHLAFPFEDLDGPTALYEQVFLPLITSIPDLERRDYIVIGGAADTGNWVGCAGYYIGVFEKPWLSIPATLHPVTMRFCEFFRVEDDTVVEMQALWDIPHVMMQARAWPMPPSLGIDFHVPGPATQDGIVTAPYDEVKAEKSHTLVTEMLGSLSKFSEGGHGAMNLEKYWHPRMSWYGPAGIGSNRRISGFRNWHQIPFLKAMPNRVGGVGRNMTFISDHDYVGFTAWPGMQATISHDGWMGIAPSGQEITMRSLDFWRCEGGVIRENWVLVDILDVYHQIGVDVFSRMRELTADRQGIALG